MSIGVRAEDAADVWQVVAGEGDAGRGVVASVPGSPAIRPGGAEGS